MKKNILLIGMLAILIAGCTSGKGLTSEEKALAKAQRELEEKQLYQAAVDALNNQEFVLEADKVVSKWGRTRFVSTNTNFVLMNKNRGTVQVAISNFFSGPNGIGGITLDGTISGIKSSTNKKGDVDYSFNIQGVGISAQINIKLTRNSNSASVTVSPYFNSNRITLQGNIVPLENSNVFKARPLP